MTFGGILCYLLYLAKKGAQGIIDEDQNIQGINWFQCKIRCAQKKKNSGLSVIFLFFEVVLGIPLKQAALADSAKLIIVANTYVNTYVSQENKILFLWIFEERFFFGNDCRRKVSGIRPDVLKVI